MDYSFEIIDSIKSYERSRTDIIKLDAEFFIWEFTDLVHLYPDFEQSFTQHFKISVSDYAVEREREKSSGIPKVQTEADQKKFHAKFGNFTILLWVNSQVIGRIGLQIIDNTKGLVRKTFVRPEFRGNNAGQLLIEKLKAEAKARGHEILKLGTMQFMKSAINLYLNTGFKQCNYNNELGLSKEGARKIDGFAMECPLKK